MRGALTIGLAAAAVGLLGGASMNCAAQDDPGVKPGFERVLRFDGTRYSKHGWNHYGPGYFELDRATGVLTARGGMGLLWYAAKVYENFVLELEFRTTDPRNNSGIFVRVPEMPSSDEYIYHSFEIQIDDASEGIHTTGAVYDAVAPSARASRPPGEWNHYRITFDGGHITVELNGTRVIDWDALPSGKIRDVAPRGYIGLQNHDDGSPVQFRNIFVRELP